MVEAHSPEAPQIELCPGEDLAAGKIRRSASAALQTSWDSEGQAAFLRI